MKDETQKILPEAQQASWTQKGLIAKSDHQPFEISKDKDHQGKSQTDPIRS